MSLIPPVDGRAVRVVAGRAAALVEGRAVALVPVGAADATTLAAAGALEVVATDADPAGGYGGEAEVVPLVAAAVPLAFTAMAATAQMATSATAPIQRGFVLRAGACDDGGAISIPSRRTSARGDGTVAGGAGSAVAGVVGGIGGAGTVSPACSSTTA
jgi:hypothetical protein